MELEHDDVCLETYRYLYDRELLAGKVAFITGGGSGIGFRITELLMRHGCDTVIASRNLGKLQESAARLEEATHKRCVPLQVDVRKYETVQKAIADTLKTFGKVDILVNSAAGNFLCPASALSANGFKTVMEIDALGTFNMCKAVYDSYFHDHGGIIVNISATLHYTGKTLQVHAGSAKAAIDAMTKHLAVEWGAKSIRVNCIAPGPIEGTEGMRKLGGKSKQNKDALATLIPLQRLGTRTEMAEAVLFLASPLSSYITGTVIVADGGEWLVTGNAQYAAAKSLL